ncbi:MAG TPA: HupE/UreJ family protein [Xanthobacteraceae bacterium]|nr:HupE/UreJ family protein [Xanthobacteraceae bacterium]
MSNLALARRLLLPALLTILAAPPAFAHHAMGFAVPATLWQGLLSGLAHPVIGLDHLAAVIAVGCIAAAHRTGTGLVAGFVLAMIAGAALHVRGTNVLAPELMVAASVLALGIAVQVRAAIGAGVLLALFVLAGLINGYALGESIVGAEATPLAGYFAGLALVQFAMALAAMALARRFAMRPYAGVAMNVRLVGAAVMGVGLAGLGTQLVA